MTVWFFWSDLSKMDQTWSNFLARNSFLAIMAFLQKLLFVQKYFYQIWSGFLTRKRFFSNEFALILKVLKGLARLWWLKAFRLVFTKYCLDTYLDHMDTGQAMRGFYLIITVNEFTSDIITPHPKFFFGQDQNFFGMGKTTKFSNESHFWSSLKVWTFYFPYT